MPITHLCSKEYWHTSLHPSLIPPVLEETARVAQVAMNVARLVVWFNEEHLPKLRVSRFGALAPS
jgi:hypothetical protein